MAWANQHGIGFNSITHSYISETDSSTRTPDAINRSEVGQHANATPRRDPANLAPPPKLNSKGSAGVHAKLVSKSKEKFTHSLDEQTYRRLIDNGKYFPGLSEAHDDLLETALDQVKHALPGDPNRAKEIIGTDLAVLTQALGEVAKTMPNAVEDVVRGLACLRNVDLLDSIRNPANATAHAINTNNPRVACPQNVGTAATLARPHADGTFDQADLDCAWRLAEVLGKTADGFTLLKKLTVSPPPPPNLHKSVEWHDDAMLHVFLDAAREMGKAAAVNGTAVVHDPHTVYNQIQQKLVAAGGADGQLTNPGQNMTATVGNLSMLEKGTLALQDRLWKSAAHTANNPTQTFDIPRNNRNGNDWAVGLIRNGIYTDAMRKPNGDPTRFALIQGRIGKLAHAIEATYTAPDTTIGKLAKGAKSVVAPQINKSPFNAYNRLGKGNDAIGFKQSERMGGIFEGRAVRDHLIDNVIKGLLTQGGGTLAAPAALLPVNPPPNGAANMPDARTLRNLVRLAILEQSSTTLFLTRYQDGDALNAIDLQKAKERVFAYLGGNAANNGNLDAATVNALDTALQTENVGYLPHNLMQWAADVGGPANAAAAVALTAAPYAAPGGNNADWHKFGQAIDFVVNSTVNTEATPDLTKNNAGMNRNQQVAAVANRFRQAIAGQELGSRFSFSSGGVVGAKTGGVTVALSQLMTLGTLRAKVNVAHDRARTAVFEAGTGTSGNEIVIATETAKKSSLGGGVGTGIVSPLGAGVDMAFGYDNTERRGALLRLDRTETGGVYGDAENNAELGEIAEMILNPTANGPTGGGAYLLPADPADQNSMLKKLLQEHPRLSVSWMGTDDSSLSAQGGANVGLGLGVDDIRLNFASASLKVNSAHGAEEWHEQGGWLRVDKTATTKSFNVNVGVAGPGVGGEIGEVNVGSVDGSVAMSGVNVASASAQIFKKNYSQRDTLIEKDGKFIKQTFRMNTFSNAADFYAYVAPRLDVMAVDKANKYEKEKVHPDPRPGDTPVLISHEEMARRREERKLVLRNEYDKLKEFVDFHFDNAELNRTYTVYLEPKDDVVDLVNALKSLGENAAAAGDKKTARDCTERMHKVLKDEKSWETCFLITFDHTNNSREVGLNTVGKNQMLDSAKFSRIVGYT